MAEVGPNPMATTPFRIHRVIKETHDTFSLQLHPPHNGACSFLPGQFNMLYVFGVGEVPISISGDPTHPESLTHTTRAVGAVTKAMWKLKGEQSLGVRGPYGVGWPIGEAAGDDIVIIAGGIGIAPLRPVIYYLLAHREEYGKIVFLYGARTPEDILYRKQIEKWRSRLDMDVLVTVDRATTHWRGNVGVVTGLIGRSPFDPYQSTALVCGPEVMMRFSVPELQKRGVEDEKIFISMERNMKCGLGLCGRCQWGPTFVCKEGPVYRYSEIKDLMLRREL